MSERLLLWAVGPDPDGRWHLAYAEQRPAPWETTTADAACGYPPPVLTLERGGGWVRVWPEQTRRPAPALAVCPLCARWAERRHSLRFACRAARRST